MSGISMSTLGRWENAGLIQPSYRTSGNLRLYNDYLLDRVNFIRIARKDGLDFDQTKKILDFMDDPQNADRLPEGYIDKLIKKTEETIRHYHGFLKDLKAVQRAERCGSHKNCKKLSGIDPVKICRECKEFR